MKRVLKQEFFARPTFVVARELVGKFLVREMPDPSTKLGIKTVAFMITETEAYDGFKDMASHARRGQTPRNTPMFDEAGVAYVYFTYGMHWMLNIVCGPKEYPAAVLIRGVEKRGVETPRSGEMNGLLTPARNVSTPLNGPAKLTKFLQIDKRLNHQKLGKKLGLWVEDRGVSVSKSKIERTGRIGVDYAGIWAQKPYRFVLKRLTVTKKRSSVKSGT